MDASRRTSAANAYVIGLGHSKRVVLYDNLIDDFPRDEVRVVVAHELGHQKHNDLLRGLAWLALVAPAGTFLTQALAERFARRERLGHAGRAAGDRAGRGAGRARARRGVERPVAPRWRRSADAFALELTRDPDDFVKFERRIAIRNVSRPRSAGAVPPAVRHPPDDDGADRLRARPSALSNLPPPVSRRPSSSASCASSPPTSARRRRRASAARPSGSRASSAPRAAASPGGGGARRTAATGGRSAC